MSGVRLGHAGAQLEGLSAGEPSATGPRQETGPDPGPPGLRALAVGVSSVTEGSLHGCAHGSGGPGWASPGTSITPIVCLLLSAAAFLPRS